tara:strand:+ start:104 stop:217 length:114 start_codon:yes stop_codon:yes gene_type:complete
MRFYEELYPDSAIAPLDSEIDFYNKAGGDLFDDFFKM